MLTLCITNSLFENFVHSKISVAEQRIMGLCSSAPDVVEGAEAVMLGFEQSDETLASNGGLVYTSRFGGSVPVRSIAYGYRMVYFNIDTAEFVATLRNTRNFNN